LTIVSSRTKQEFKIINLLQNSQNQNFYQAHLKIFKKIGMLSFLALSAQQCPIIENTKADKYVRIQWYFFQAFLGNSLP